jgi:hypothetical protein
VSFDAKRARPLKITLNLLLDRSISTPVLREILGDIQGMSSLPCRDARRRGRRGTSVVQALHDRVGPRHKDLDPHPHRGSVLRPASVRDPLSQEVVGSRRSCARARARARGLPGPGASDGEGSPVARPARGPAGRSPAPHRPRARAARRGHAIAAQASSVANRIWLVRSRFRSMRIDHVAAALVRATGAQLRRGSSDHRSAFVDRANPCAGDRNLATRCKSLALGLSNSALEP